MKVMAKDKKSIPELPILDFWMGQMS